MFGNCRKVTHEFVYAAFLCSALHCVRACEYTCSCMRLCMYGRACDDVGACVRVYYLNQLLRKTKHNNLALVLYYSSDHARRCNHRPTRI